jgi:hypothetical protein
MDHEKETLNQNRLIGNEISQIIERMRKEILNTKSRNKTENSDELDTRYGLEQGKLSQRMQICRSAG